MTSKRERVLSALFDRLKAAAPAIVKRNEALPQSVPTGGLVILRDGDPGAPDVTLNPRTEFYGHRAEIEAFVTKPAGGGGEVALDGLLVAIGTALAADRITLNGVAWTFVTGSPSGNQTQIGASLDATLTALASNLNAAADAQVSKCTYTANTTVDRLEIEFDTSGTTGNSFSLAASAESNGTVSAATLIGGGYRHEWLSGGDDIPSFTLRSVIRSWSRRCSSATSAR